MSKTKIDKSKEIDRDFIQCKKHMDCFVCGKKKEGFEVWTNKVVIGATYDSEFQDNEIIRSLSEKSVICHNCMKKIHGEVNEKRKTE